MEFWIIQGIEKIQLPVPPAEFYITKENNNEVVNIQTLGEINLIGKSKLASISLSSFFPAKEYPFVQTRDLLKPYDYVKLIESFRTSGKPIRLLITDTDINDFFTIESFEYGEKDGSGDVYFTIAFKQYKTVTIATQTIVKRTTQTKTSSSTTTKKKITNRKVARAKTKEDHIKQIKQPAYKQKGYVSYKDYMLAEKV